MNTYARNGFMWNNIIILRPLAWPNLVNPTSRKFGRDDCFKFIKMGNNNFN